MKQYWLMKSEPSAFSIDDLKNCPKKTDGWDGVRNYQARNMMRDEMRVGDLAFFYHSNANPPGIAGIMQVTRTAYPDDKQFDPKSKYYDPTSTPDNPRWWMVDVTFKEKFKKLISLDELKQNPGLAGMALLRKGNRLSIMPVTHAEWELILQME
jgi:predicted RNA-binding protein with PUA-like domain